MAKACVIALVSLAIYTSSSFNFAYATGAAESNKFKVVGHVYCDTCRVEFETKISQPISGAVVKLECRNRTDGALTFQSPEITTTQSGDYSIDVEGDFQDSDCDVTLVKSPRPDCSDLTEDWRKARVVITSLDGVSGDIRFANSLGFKKKEALPECKKVLTELGYYELQDELGQEVVS
ncbi:Alg9-like mannosyltransferase family isoform 1 [Hibiscus syriacus]|uniref:Alg9-like mannosyltransferase family isoform 1 n=1 Tax=Hibiscus syriacus TaxID=106335 RepID=A0A6A2WVL1_HIBSY|nr:pollen allergen Che a 1-like [Hibiscus syriacus]KAE8653836.1 Alg9-like mannosyltransferase family isoform 1 [Hibiscus syriacus]